MSNYQPSPPPPPPRYGGASVPPPPPAGYPSNQHVHPRANINPQYPQLPPHGHLGSQHTPPYGRPTPAPPVSSILNASTPAPALAPALAPIPYYPPPPPGRPKVGQPRCSYGVHPAGSASPNAVAINAGYASPPLPPQQHRSPSSYHLPTTPFFTSAPNTNAPVPRLYPAQPTPYYQNLPPQYASQGPPYQPQYASPPAQSTPAPPWQPSSSVNSLRQQAGNEPSPTPPPPSTRPPVSGQAGTATYTPPLSAADQQQQHHSPAGASHPPAPAPTATTNSQTHSSYTPGSPRQQTLVPMTYAMPNTRSAPGPQSGGQPSHAPPPAPHDPLPGLSAQMNGLNMGLGGQSLASQPSRRPVDSNAPRPPPPIRATGQPLDVVPYCPETRSVEYSLYWYRLPDVPDFMICTKCHADHIQGTPLASQFERIKRPDHSYSACCFWFPRVKEVLWPRAVRSGSMDSLRAFMKKRVGINLCKGRNAKPASEGIKWFGMTNSEINGFIACEACYEDRVAGTRFESRFSPFRQQKADEKWMCDLCVPYISRAVVQMAKRNDWAGFIAASNRRLQLPGCEGKEIQSNSGTWYFPRRGMENVSVCEACYLDKLALTRFEGEFERHVPSNGLDSFINQFTQLWSCKLTASNIPMVFALENAIEQRDFSVFANAAPVICRLVSCTANGIVRGRWWTIAGGCDNFDICEACYVGILRTNGHATFFESAQRNPEATLVCDFCVTSPRFNEYVNKYVEAIDKGVFSYYTDYVRKFAAVPVCPGIKHREKSTWWGYPEALFCQDCYIGFVADTALGSSVPVKREYDERAMICQIWSPRMRKMWLEVCAAGARGSPESEAALAEFRAFGTKRLQMYNATVPQMEFIRAMKVMTMQNAMHQGLLSVMYNGMDGLAVVSNATDGHLHGNSQVGWYATEQGAQGAQMFNNMQAGFANANRMDKWMQMAQLEMVWKQVE